MEQNPIHLSRCPICQGTGVENFLQGPDRFHARAQLYQLVRCPACSMVWLENPPEPAEMNQHYGADYDRFIGRAGETSPESWRTRRRIVSQYRPTGTLLDMGCGSGSFLAALKGDSWDLHGVEISPVAAKKAEARSGARVFVGDVLDAPFPAESFDVVTCFDVLEHLYKPREVMENIANWLKPGGIFYLLVPNIDSGEANFFRSFWYGLELPRHLSHFSPKPLRFAAESVGLQEVSLETCPNSALEPSTRYILDDIAQKVGIPRLPLAMGKVPRLPWKVVRKALRMTISPLVYRMISLSGGGESIHAIFSKGPLQPSGVQKTGDYSTVTASSSEAVSR